MARLEFELTNYELGMTSTQSSFIFMYDTCSFVGDHSCTQEKNITFWLTLVYIYIYIYIYIYEEKLKTSNPNRKGRFIEKQSQSSIYIYIYIYIHIYKTCSQKRRQGKDWNIFVINEKKLTSNQFSGYVSEVRSFSINIRFKFSWSALKWKWILQSEIIFFFFFFFFLFPLH